MKGKRRTEDVASARQFLSLGIPSPVVGALIGCDHHAVGVETGVRVNLVAVLVESEREGHGGDALAIEVGVVLNCIAGQIVTEEVMIYS